MSTELARLKELTDLLRESIDMCRQDRTLALANYESLKDQRDAILQRDMESSEDGRIEMEMNKALKLVFDSGTKMDSVINAITKILITQLTNESREKVAATFIGGNNFDPRKQIITAPVDLNKLIEDSD